MRPLSERLGTSFAAFVVVGTIGFLIESALLTWLMVGEHWTALQGRAVSFPVAVTATWWLNRRLAFAGRGALAVHREYVGYLVIQTAGACINLLVFAGCIRMWPQLAAWPVVPLAIGQGVALLFNFGIARTILYSRQRAPTETA